MAQGRQSPEIESSTAVQDFEATRKKRHERFDSASTNLSATIDQPNSYSNYTGSSKNSGVDLNNPGSSSKDTGKSSKFKNIFKREK